MDVSSKFGTVEYLVERKFKLARHVKALHRIKPESVSPARVAEIEEYERELRSLSSEELQRLCAAERAKDAERARSRS